MSSFEWMELQSLTNDIELSRSRLAEARGRGDRGRIRALEEEITRAEKTRLQLLTHISTNIASAPENAQTTKAKEAVEAAQASSALVAEALGGAVVADAVEPEEAPEPAQRRGRRGRAADADTADDDDAEPAAAEAESAAVAAAPAAAPAPPKEVAASAAAATPVAAPAPAPKAEMKGGSTVWDQLTPGDLERAKNELGARRAETLARHAEELRGLDAEQSQLETLEQAIEMFLQKMRGANTVVELRQQGNG